MDINQLNKFVSEKLLKKAKHPKYDLFIWNYSETVQVGRLWNPVLLKCRGLITDETGKIVARSFSKFFNIEETSEIPNEKFRIFDKADGSLGILFFYNGEWIISSRGSFQSLQAIKAKEMLKKYNIQNLDKRLSYVFEIIYPENRIVVDYDNKESLVFLSAFNPNKDIEIFEIDGISSFEYMKKRGFEVIEEFFLEGKSIDELKKLDLKNKEGFVLLFENGLRIKVKFEHYLKIHKILNKLSLKNIFIMFKTNENIEEVIENIPDEFHKFVRDSFKIFKDDYEEIVNSTKNVIDEFLKEYIIEPTKKNFVKFIKNNNNVKREHQKYLFSLFDKKSPEILNDNIFEIMEDKFKHKFKEEENGNLLFNKFNQEQKNEPSKEILNESSKETVLKELLNEPSKEIVKPKCVICDLDGTLAHNTSGRSNYDMKRVGEDSVDPVIKNLLNLIKKEYVIIICTGRSDDAREKTIEWLLKNGIEYSELFMRAYKNKEKDFVVKELMWKKIEEKYKIEFMLEDRDQVVKHARSLGHKVYQVQEGDY